MGLPDAITLITTVHHTWSLSSYLLSTATSSFQSMFFSLLYQWDSPQHLSPFQLCNGWRRLFKGIVNPCVLMRWCSKKKKKKKRGERELQDCKIATDYSTRVKTLISAASPLYCPKSGSALTRVRTMGRKVIQAPETLAVNFSKDVNL